MAISSNPQIAVAAGFTLGWLLIRTARAATREIITPFLILVAAALALVTGILLADSLGLSINVSDPEQIIGFAGPAD